MKPQVRFFLLGLVAAAFYLSYGTQFFKSKVESGKSELASVDKTQEPMGEKKIVPDSELAPDTLPEPKKNQAVVPPQKDAPPSGPSFAEIRNQFWATVPSLKTIRAEVAQNPHGSPKQYKDLAHSFTLLMQYGLQNPKNAGDSFSVLSECVKAAPTQVPLAVRASCLKTAGKLSKKFPEMDKDYQTLHGMLDQRLKKHAVVMEQLEASLQQ